MPGVRYCGPPAGVGRKADMSEMEAGPSITRYARLP